MYLEIFQSRKGLVADKAPVWFLVRVSAYVDQHFVPNKQNNGVN